VGGGEIKIIKRDLFFKKIERGAWEGI